MQTHLPLDPPPASSGFRDQDIAAVLTTIADFIPRFHDQPSVGEVAEKTGDPFLVLVSTLLSLRTREETTRAAMWPLFAVARTPQQLLALPEERLAEIIRPVRFADGKARTLRSVAQALVEQHGGHVPDTLEALLALKGVGRKTANLVLTLGFGKPGICVDIHVHRICNRLGYEATRDPDSTEAALRRKLPRRLWIPINNWLVTFGRNQCTPLSPRCSDCPVAGPCQRVGVTAHR